MSTFAAVSILMVVETAVLGVPATLAAVWAQRNAHRSRPQPRPVIDENPLPHHRDRAGVPCTTA